MTATLRGWGWGRGYDKNEMLLDVRGGGLVSVLDLEPLVFFH